MPLHKLRLTRRLPEVEVAPGNNPAEVVRCSTLAALDRTVVVVGGIVLQEEGRPKRMCEYEERETLIPRQRESDLRITWWPHMCIQTMEKKEDGIPWGGG